VARLAGRTVAHYHTGMLLFVLLSIPLGCFCLWFGWKAWRVGRRDVVVTMGILAFFCFATALLSIGWAYLYIHP